VTTAGLAVADGEQMLAMFAAAAGHLEDSAPAINAISVYPVPDGDTGSNMSATLREAVREASRGSVRHGAGAVLDAIARGALFGARGNSGVILSQALRGFAEVLADEEAVGAAGWADALRSASTRAYTAVAQPREGTMLTVLRAAGEGAAATLGRSESPALADVMEASVTAAASAEAATIDQLPQLREAGVTDSGGEGICVILRALHASFIGTPLPVAVPAASPDLHGLADEAYGHCTEFLVERTGAPVDVEAIRRWLINGDSRSIVVVGDGDLVRVHVHTLAPEAILAEAASFGRLRRVKVDDMDRQFAAFTDTGSGATAKVGVLALSPGDGFDAIFRELGAHAMRLELVKPAAGEIARAADALRIPDVIVLPNHENVVWAAQQAADIASTTLHVLDAVTVPQGIAAAIAFDPSAAVDTLVEAMAVAAHSMRTVEVTRAAASRSVEGIGVKEGQALVLVDTHVVAAVDGLLEGLVVGVRHAAAAGAELITVYMGEERVATPEAVTAALTGAFPGVAVETLDGGQPLYPFIASIE